MSGAEIVIAAAVVSLTSGAASATYTINEANQIEKDEKSNIRDTQLQLRIQEGQQNLARVNNLRSVLATQEVSLGNRNIGAGSGALVQKNLANFQDDQELSNLNYLTKQNALNKQYRLSKQRNQATKFSAVNDFIGSGAKTVISAVSGLSIPSGAAGAAAAGSAGSAGAGAGAATGASKAGAYTPIASQSYFNSQFNLNR